MNQLQAWIVKVLCQVLKELCTTKHSFASASVSMQVTKHQSQLVEILFDHAVTTTFSRMMTKILVQNSYSLFALK